MSYQLSHYYKSTKSNRDIFQELMAFKVKEILLVANLYDSYSVAREGEFFERIEGEYRQLNLYAAPRITNVSSHDDAMSALRHCKPDMVILMAGLDKKMPLELAQKIKEKHPDLAILLLVNNNSDLSYFGDEGTKSNAIDRVFVWNGDSKVFLAMIKYVEDKKNVANDTRIGDSRIILLVEDSIRYYTRYLPILYSLVMVQTQNVVSEHSPDDLNMILKMRARPKILLASNYEEAQNIVKQYGDNLLCVISDMTFEKDGKKQHNVGQLLLKEITAQLAIPCLMQSSDKRNIILAKELGVSFLWKDCETLSHEILSFLTKRCGFGDFAFKTTGGKCIDKASVLEEFKEKLSSIPVESIKYHSGRQGISSWFMARGEINLAKKLRRHRLSETPHPEDLRKYILDAIFDNYLQKLRGRVIEFDTDFLSSNRIIVRLGNGSLGGKGRGLAFLSHFIENTEFGELLPGITVATPKTAIIGVEEFNYFIEENHLYDEIYARQDIEKIKDVFVNSQLSPALKEKLKIYVDNIKSPLAIRSSGLFEDSMLQPFAGVYATYFLPNNHPDVDVRFSQLEIAVKLVYASIFSETALNYFDATKYKIEEERMAVIIQEIVGQSHGQYFYPTVSGVAQSYNYYPFSYMKPEDGFSVAAIGMGELVVGGEKSHRFCPQYPKLELTSVADQIKDSQTHFYAIDLQANFDVKHEKDITVKLPLKMAEKDGVLKHTAQVYDIHNQRLGNDFSLKGPRVVNFANILKYDRWPLAKSLSVLLDFFEQAMGAPVEIEYAVEMDGNEQPILYLLQIKPLIKKDSNVTVNIDSVNKESAVCVLEGGMGNGHYKHIRDVVYMKTELFDKTQTDKMAQEVAYLNKKLQQEEKEYILVGAGRWGTRDRFIGVPVFWSQIANARIIIEMGLKELPLEASLGSHFFHNVTSMNVGYFSAPYNSEANFVNIELLEDQKVINETSYFKHVRFEQPLDVKMDGKNRKALIAIQL